MNKTILTLLKSDNSKDIKLGLELAGYRNSDHLNAALRGIGIHTRFDYTVTGNHAHRNGSCLRGVRPPKCNRR